MGPATVASHAELLDLVGEFYDSAIDPSRWPGALKRLAVLVDAGEAAIAVHDVIAAKFALRVSWNVNPEFEARMLEHFAANPFVPSAWYVDIDQPVSAFGLVEEDELKRGLWYKRTLGAFGYGDAALALLARSVSHFGSLSIHRKAEQPNFGERELAVLRPIIPHVRRAVMIADLLDTRALERDMLSATLELMTVGVVLTDDACRLVHANAAALRWLGDGAALRRDGDELAARHPESRRELRQAIARATEGGALQLPKSGISVVLKSAEGRDLAAWVLPLDGGLRRNLGAEYAATVAVFIRELSDTAPFPAELFVRRYGITPAECRVLVLLMQGMTPREAAEMLGTSLPTAKTHLTRLFEKTGTQRQADLIRLAMSALAPAQRRA